MVTMAELCSRLRQIRSLRFDASSESNTGWDGTGIGNVVVTEPAEQVIVFEEFGIWQPSASEQAAIRFENVFRWSAFRDTLRLEHLRFGPSSPVFLFDLVANENDPWQVMSPHQCREDCYAASLWVEEDQIVVAWSINGPRKRQSIRYTYW